MNRVKVWVFTLLVVGAGAAALVLHARSLRDRAIVALDGRLAAGAGQATTALRASLREAAAASAVVALSPELRAALEGEVPLPRRSRGRAAAPASGGRDEKVVQAAADAALAAAEGALGGGLPAGRLVLAADMSTLSRRAIGGDPDALLRGAAEGTARAGFARWEGELWAAAGAPAGEGAGVVVMVPVGEEWAGAVSAASGVDATVAGIDLKAAGTAPASVEALVVAAALRAAGKVAQVGALGPVDVGGPGLPVQLPRVGMLLASAPALLARAVPVEGLKGAAVVLSVPAAKELSPVVVLQWRGLAALAVLLLLGVLFGFLVRPSEIVPSVPEHLVAAAARIERGDFSTRAPQLAGKLGTIAAALNRAAEAAGNGAGAAPTPSPGSITREFFNAPAEPPPEAEPSAFDFPTRPPRQRPVQAEPRPTAAALSGDPFQAAPLPSRPTPIGDVATSAEVLQAAARAAPPPIPNATMTRTMPAVSGPDDESAHWQQVFQDFVRTRNECGEPAESLTFERFRQKLESNKATLVAKYQCKTVRFQVYVKEGKAALKATPVR